MLRNRGDEYSRDAAWHSGSCIDEKNLNDIVLSDITRMAALCTFPNLVFGRKSRLDVEICFTFIAKPENAEPFIGLRNCISTVRTFPFFPGWAEIHVGAVTGGTIHPFFDMSIHAAVPADCLIFESFKWGFGAAVRTNHELSPGGHFDFSTAAAASDFLGNHF